MYYRIGAFKKVFAELLLNIISKIYRNQTIVNDEHMARNKMIDALPLVCKSLPLV